MKHILHLVSPGYETFTPISSNFISLYILHWKDPIVITTHAQNFGFLRCQSQNFLKNLFPRRGAILYKEDNKVNWRISRKVVLALQQNALAPQQGPWAESNNASKFQASNATSGSVCLLSLSLQGYFPEGFHLSWSGSWYWYCPGNCLSIQKKLHSWTLHITPLNSDTVLHTPQLWSWTWNNQSHL